LRIVVSTCFFDPHPTQVDADVEMEEDSDAELDEISAKSTTGPIELLGAQPTIGTAVGEWFVERAKYIPLRLSLAERKYLRLLDAALQVSEYTDKIDTISYGLSKAKRIVYQIRELCAILSGLVLSADYKLGQELFADRDFQRNSEFYQQIFELGRRHKIMNPDKMRTTYGKLIYLLQVSMGFLGCFYRMIDDSCVAGQSIARREGHAQLFMCQTHPNRVQRAGAARRPRAPS
jgi:hypothetical protein